MRAAITRTATVEPIPPPIAAVLGPEESSDRRAINNNNKTNNDKGRLSKVTSLEIRNALTTYS